MLIIYCPFRRRKVPCTRAPSNCTCTQSERHGRWSIRAFQQLWTHPGGQSGPRYCCAAQTLPWWWFLQGMSPAFYSYRNRLLIGLQQRPSPPSPPPNSAVTPTAESQPFANRPRRSATLSAATRPKRAPSPMGERILKGHFDGFN